MEKGSRMLRTVLLRALKGESEGEDLTRHEGDDESGGVELGTARSILEPSSTAPCAMFVDPLPNHLRSSELKIFNLDFYLYHFSYLNS